MDKIDLKNPVMAVAVLSQKIAELEKKVEGNEAEVSDNVMKELGDCLTQRGAMLLAMGDKTGAEADMKRFLELNPEKVGELNGEFKAEGRE